jgi:uncharacterized protein with HEPN domain
MSVSILDLLAHIRDETAFLVSCTMGKSREAFIDDPVLKRACVRAIEIIGEASKKVPDDFRAGHTMIEWKSMAGMRDRLIHDYMGVDYFIVYDVATRLAPALLSQVEALIEDCAKHATDQNNE